MDEKLARNYRMRSKHVLPTVHNESWVFQKYLIKQNQYFEPTVTFGGQLPDYEANDTINILPFACSR